MLCIFTLGYHQLLLFYAFKYLFSVQENSNYVADKAKPELQSNDAQNKEADLHKIYFAVLILFACIMQLFIVRYVLVEMPLGIATYKRVGIGAFICLMITLQLVGNV